jgi:hypothetical protein
MRLCSRIILENQLVQGLWWLSNNTGRRLKGSVASNDGHVGVDSVRVGAVCSRDSFAHVDSGNDGDGGCRERGGCLVLLGWVARTYI